MVGLSAGGRHSNSLITRRAWKIRPEPVTSVSVWGGLQVLQRAEAAAQRTAASVSRRPYLRCWLMILVISNMDTCFLPKTALSFSSALIMRLFAAS